MGRLTGTQTEINLLRAFAGKSQECNRYDYFAEQAESEGLPVIAHFFQDTAEHARMHALKLFEYFEGGKVTVCDSFSAEGISGTLTNLIAAAGDEYLCWSCVYPAFADIARQEGFESVAVLFDDIAVADQFHERRFRDGLRMLESDRMTRRPEAVEWLCSKCAYTREGREAPFSCPVCGYPAGYFIVNRRRGTTD